MNDWKSTLESEGLSLNCRVDFLIQNGGVSVVFLNGKAIRTSRMFRKTSTNFLKPSGFALLLDFPDQKITEYFVGGKPVSKFQPLDSTITENWKEPLLTAHDSKSRSDHRLNLKHYIRSLRQN